MRKLRTICLSGSDAQAAPGLVKFVETLDPGPDIRVVGWVELDHEDRKAVLTGRPDKAAVRFHVDLGLTAEQTAGDARRGHRRSG
jgi:hypothetical protein